MKRIARSLFYVVGITFLLSSCSSGAPSGKTVASNQPVGLISTIPNSKPGETTTPKTKPVIITTPQTLPSTTIAITKPHSTSAPATVSPTTTVPATKPAATKPAATKPAATKPAVTKPPVTKPPATKPPATSAPKSEDEYTYILNTNTHKFHYDGCYAADRIKASNRKEFTGTRYQAIRKGYSPCGICEP